MSSIEDMPSSQLIPPLEIGVILAGRLKSRHRQLILKAINQLQSDLLRWFPAYRWSINLRPRRDIGESNREESTRLLSEAAAERDSNRWDFALLITDDELLAHFRPFALAALSRPLDSAVISTARLVPELDGPSTGDDAALEDHIIVDRLATVMLHAMAHLGGVSAAREQDHYLYRPRDAADLDAMQRFDDAELFELDKTFRAVADQRLEERHEHLGSRWRFLAQACWLNREQILEAIVAAKPWEFPRHLSRLTTAAVSTVALLLMTAEAWDLGLSQSTLKVSLMAVIVLLFTTTFVIIRQRLVLLRHRRLSEQRVLTSVSALVIVMAGLAVTWSCMFLLALLASSTLFDAELIQSWASSTNPDSDVGLATLIKMSAFCASIGLLIGSLGASFEEQHHFQHVIFVDEEL